MRRAFTNPTGAIPRWQLILGSLIIVAHLGAVGVSALAVPSGPWPSPEGFTMAPPPEFLQDARQIAVDKYLWPIKLTNSYHFPSNRPGAYAVYFEVHLKDKSGKELATLRFPDAQANSVIRDRQTLLARWLTEDEPVQPMAGEAIPAPGQKVRMVTIWDIAGNHQLKLKTVPEHLIPRDRPVMSPGEWPLLLARSYTRYLCRTHEAASGELIRHTREPVPPFAFRMGELPPNATEDLVANFGEVTLE